MSSKNVIVDSDVVSTNSNTTYILTNDTPIPNPAIIVTDNPIVGVSTVDSSNVFVDTNKSKKKKNYIVDDGPQYDDDELIMRNRGGRINRKLPSGKSSESESEITTIDDIKKDVEDAGLTGTPIIQLSNPNIDFLILVYPTKLDSLRNTNGLLVTGTKYFKKLKSDLINKNPYAYNIAFDDRFIVKLILKDWIDLFKNMQDLESEVNIRMFRNNFIDSDYTIDYKQLIGFIDWFVSKPDYTNFSDKGIISTSVLSSYIDTNNITVQI
jgi:hypothetical protein